MKPETSALVAIIIAVLGSSGSLWVALANRPKMSAEAKAANASGEVALSADARQWANAANARAERADERAARAEDRARAAEDRLDSLEDKFDLLVGYVGSLKDQIVALDGNPMPPPRDLIPPLTHP